MLKNYLNGLIINDRIVENGRDLLRSSPTSLVRQGQIEQFAHIQLSFGYLYRWKSCFLALVMPLMFLVGCTPILTYTATQHLDLSQWFTDKKEKEGLG